MKNRVIFLGWTKPHTVGYDTEVYDIPVPIGLLNLKPIMYQHFNGPLLWK